jgi:hypothetical protein
MGAINFNPAQVLAKLSRDRAGEISRFARLAGGHWQNQISALGRPEVKKAGAYRSPLPIREPPTTNTSEVVNCANLLIGRDSENQKSEGASANPASLLIGDGPAWLKGLATLDPNQPSADFGGLWWRDLIRDTERFLPIWGRQAADLGWTTLDLFSVHRLAPAARFSCMGLLLLVRGGRVAAITAERAVIERQSGAHLTYTRRPPEPECVPIWELEPRDGGRAGLNG